MIYMINKMNESKYKKQLHSVQKQVNTFLNMKIPTTCPYCGGKMIMKTIGDYDPTSERASDLFCVCENYNTTCTCSLKVKMDSDGKKIPMGLPADNNLKSLRCEAHYYINAVVRYGIFERISEVYEYLSGKENIQKDYLHMSMLQEGRCRSIILYLLQILAAYPDKVNGRLFPFISNFKGVNSFTTTDLEAKKLIEKIRYQIR